MTSHLLLPGVEHRTSIPRSDTLHEVRGSWASQADWGSQAHLTWQYKIRLIGVERIAMSETVRQRTGSAVLCSGSSNKRRRLRTIEQTLTSLSRAAVPDHVALPCRTCIMSVCNICKWGKRWRICLRHYATGRKVPGSISDGVIGIFNWNNPPQTPGNLWAWRGIAFMCILI